MSYSHQTATGVLTHFVKKNDKHYPYIQFETALGSFVEGLCEHLSLEEASSHLDLSSINKLPAYAVTVTYEEVNPQFFTLSKWIPDKDYGIYHCPPTFFETKESKRRYMFPYKILLTVWGGYPILYFLLSYFDFFLAFLKQEISLAFTFLAMILPVFVLPVVAFYLFQDYLAGCEKLIYNKNSFYHYNIRYNKFQGSNHIYTKVLSVNSIKESRQKVKLLGEFEQAVVHRIHKRKFLYKSSKTHPYRNKHDEILVHRPPTTKEPDSEKAILDALNKTTLEPQLQTVGQLTFKKVTENTPFLLAMLQGNMLLKSYKK